MNATQDTQPLSLAPAAAALLAGGIGSVALGLLTVLAEASEPIRLALRFYAPAGPLSGKTTVAVLVWLASWAILRGVWNKKEVDFGKVANLAFILLALGLIGTFPPFFLLFAAE